MGKINKEWHLANKMPKNPTLEERMLWHREHLKHCDCRPTSPEFRRELKEYFKEEKQQYELPHIFKSINQRAGSDQ
ncbi:MAG: hypothetical protein ACYC5F_00820 [Thermoleophilia bacterium]